MNLSPTWVDFLEAEGFEVVHWSFVGDPCATDTTLMAWAVANGCVVLTHDLDFGVLLALTHAVAPSVVQVRVQDPSPQSVGHDLIRVLRLREDLLKSGALLTIDKNKDRVRLLPFAGRTGAND